MKSFFTALYKFYVKLNPFGLHIHPYTSKRGFQVTTTRLQDFQHLKEKTAISIIVILIYQDSQNQSQTAFIPCLSLFIIY